jgi:hypothetical protein
MVSSETPKIWWQRLALLFSRKPRSFDDRLKNAEAEYTERYKKMAAVRPLLL